MSPFFRAIRFLLGLAVLSASTYVHAAYPDRPVRLIVTYQAGGSADVLARIFARSFSDQLGQPVVVENKPGGAGVIGISAVTQSPADGNTLLFCPPGPLVNLPLMGMKLPFDVYKDLTYITLLTDTSKVIVVPASLGIKTLEEFVAQARAHPGKLSFGSAGTGSMTHLTAELMMSLAKIEMVHVPYKSGSPIVMDMLNGNLQMFIGEMPNVLPQVRAGKLVALAVTDAKRSTFLPDVPTTAEAGYPDLIGGGGAYGLCGPANLPPAVTKRIHEAAVEALKSPGLVELFSQQGSRPEQSTGAQYMDYIRSETARWDPIIKSRNISSTN